MSVDTSLKDIQKWMAVNRSMLQEIYQQFLHIYNDKHGMALKNTKSLYHDFCLHLYYNYVDDYGYTLFETQEEKNAHYTRFRKPETVSWSSNKANMEEGDAGEAAEAAEEIEFEEEED